MRAAVLALLLAAAPAGAQAPSPQAVVSACIALTEAALARAEGPRREALRHTLELMHTALRGLHALGDAAAEAAPHVDRLPTRVEDCMGEG